MDAHVPLLRARPCGVSTALSQAVKRRNDVSHGQVEVRAETTKPNAHGDGLTGLRRIWFWFTLWLLFLLELTLYVISIDTPNVGKSY
jgi:hypothetical protein